MYIYFCYSKTARSFTIMEKQFVLSTLNDRRAWPVKWIETHNAQLANWNVVLESQQFIDDNFPSRINGLSVTQSRANVRQGPHAPKTFFSYTNWSEVPLKLRGKYNIHEYRTYVVLHECGHALGLGHRECTGGPAPIMLQQTRGIKECTKNLWPLDIEIDALYKMY